MSNDEINGPLFETAKQAFDAAYAPYSKFSVGAAILDNKGDIYSGCNVENAAYPQGLCAEANAIGTMVASGGRLISTIVVMADGDGSIFPCGGCRQKLLEFCDENTKVLIATPDAITQEVNFSELMPFAFGANNLT